MARSVRHAGGIALALLVSLAAAACQASEAPPVATAPTGVSATPPELTAPVNDFANVINADEEAQLESLIRKLQAASADIIVVATVKTFQPAADIRVYANEMFENHGKGIGQKGKDNGMLVLLAVDDREVWAEVGYDLEGIIPDGFAGETSRQTMAPFFRNGDYGGGVLAGVAVFARRIAEARNVTLENVPIRRPVRSDRDDEDSGFPLVLIIFVVMVVINLVRGAINSLTGGRRGRRRRRWGSSVGPFGAGYGGWSGGGGGWSGGGSFGGGFSGFGGGRSGGGGGGASW
jgi:uncharacterized protein